MGQISQNFFKKSSIAQSQTQFQRVTSFLKSALSAFLLNSSLLNGFKPDEMFGWVQLPRRYYHSIFIVLVSLVSPYIHTNISLQQLTREHSPEDFQNGYPSSSKITLALSMGSARTSFLITINPKGNLGEHSIPFWINRKSLFLLKLS